MRPRLLRLLVLPVLLLTALAACGDDDEASDTGTGAGDDRPAITVASFNFPESETLAHMYAQALEANGFDVTVRANLGNRELVLPALESGEIDLVPEYVGTLLETLSEGAGEATADVDESLSKLRDRLDERGLVALEPAEAFDANAIVVTEETAEEHNLETISDLAEVDDQLVFGGPPECPQRPLCLIGLRDLYGLEFSDVKQLDAGGPITREALKNGEIDVGLLFSSDGAIEREGFVVLEDDKGLQPAENVIPVIREEVLTDEIRDVLNEVSAGLSTDDLIELNARVSLDKEDADAAAEAYLREQGILEEE